ncbi:MAG: His/Gly/Thr/Pro-type tRNA ligase C-terminal domain-containing protein, partial [Chloroflexota bacterium]
GPKTPGVGFGSGIERIILGLRAAGIEPEGGTALPVFIAYMGHEAKAKAVDIVFELRDKGIGTRIAFALDRRSLKSQMREAGRHESRFVLIIGESELESGEIQVRDMVNHSQHAVPFPEIAAWLEARGIK